jgi:hypothetical protein
MRVFVANVGVNSNDASERGLRSPLFGDGTFEMVPIKEASKFALIASSRTYSALPAWTGRVSSLAAFIPERMRAYAAHDDPDFWGMTYGDKLTGRAAALREAGAGDLLLFLARLWDHADGRSFGGGSFHFVGAMFVTHNLEFRPGALPQVPEEVLTRVRRNAHLLRDAAAIHEPYRVIVGDQARSARFWRPILVTGDVAALLFAGTYAEDSGTFLRGREPIRNKNGAPRTLKWFGSITRSVQWFLDDAAEADRPFVTRLLALVDSAGRAVLPRG